MSKQADPAKLSKPKTRFIPTADERTVHTKGNKQALRNQLLEANQPTEKEPLPFDHQLLLGHVSMLTDLVIVPKFPEHNSAPSSGSYIITADRDEHIRITRGMPQAHIIEGYCLGHSQFVSRLCLPVRLPRLLISGGGDDYLALWDWKAGKIRQKLDLRPALTAYMAIEGVRPSLSPEIEPQETKASQEAADDARDAKPDTKTTPKVAVSGIWQIASTFDSDGEQDTATDIVVALEGIPALFMLQLSAKGDLSFRQTLPLQGNPLDIAVHPSKALFIVSIDNIHDARSTTKPRSEPGKTLIQAYSAATAPLGESRWQEDVDSAATWLEIIDQAASALDLTQLRSLRELLYDVEKIRKRPGSED
ncbi:MAG: hypothetical protein M1825_002942 [Sarcosagium campestre]|nr:MAG: hypothetical protein M1825_002942 [Sarcosagium campestre]